MVQQKDLSRHYQTVYFARPDALKGSLPQTLAAVRPTIFFGVPRVWEKIMAKIKAAGAATKGLKKSIATWAKGIGMDFSLAKQGRASQHDVCPRRDA